MRRLRIASLVLSSFLLLSGCAISKYHRLACDKVVLQPSYITPVVPASGVVKYKASIDVLKNHLSGLLLVKQTDSLTRRLVFVTELGLKMFDFEEKAGQMNAVYVFDPLNKPALIDALKRNFSHMFLLDAYGWEAGVCSNNGRPVYRLTTGSDKRFYNVSDTLNDALVFQETFHRNRRESKTEYSFDAKTASYTTIQTKQYGLIKFFFELNAIPSNHD